jgi:prophage antirepressor-like protein
MKVIKEFNLFKNEIFPNGVRTCEIDGALWFVAVDVCTCLGLSQVTRAMSRLEDDESQVIDLQTLTINKSTKTDAYNCVSESGMYHLIFGSRKPVAKKFRKWVTSEVLPAIRKNGEYSASSEELAWMRGELTEMQARQPHHKDTIAGKFGISKSESGAILQELANKGKLAFIERYVRVRKYLAPINSDIVIGQTKYGTLLFNDNVHKYVRKQTDWTA